MGICVGYEMCSIAGSDEHGNIGCDYFNHGLCEAQNLRRKKNQEDSDMMDINPKPCDWKRTECIGFANCDNFHEYSICDDLQIGGKCGHHSGPKKKKICQPDEVLAEKGICIGFKKCNNYKYVGDIGSICEWLTCRLDQDTARYCICPNGPNPCGPKKKKMMDYQTDLEVQRIQDFGINISNEFLQEEKSKTICQPDEVLASPGLADSASDRYKKLEEVLRAAYHQAAAGKGKERHSTGQPFDRQPICTITRMVGSGFPLGQAMKKIDESQRLPNEKAIFELLGAINFIAAQIIILGERQAVQDGAGEAQGC